LTSDAFTLCYESAREALLTEHDRHCAEELLVSSMNFERLNDSQDDELGYGIRGFPHETVESLPKWLED